MPFLTLSKLRAKLKDQSLIIVGIVAAYITVAIVGGVWLLSEYMQASTLPVSTKKFFTITLLYGPLVVLAYALFGAAFEGVIMLLIGFAKEAYRLVLQVFKP
jgi:lipid-A-disaccharide synthase-like uncharacterized protein